MTPTLNLVLWIAQALLAFLFLGAGAPKILGRGLERWTGFSDLPRGEVIFIGIVELLGAVGLVLPAALGVLPWLTPLAALGLGLVVMMAAGFHLRADERLNAFETALWACMAFVVAIGRWLPIASPIRVPPWTLVALLAVLTPMSIVVVVILLKRPVPSAARDPR